MRGFLILFCIALAHADKLGYNYASGGSHHGFGNRFKNRRNSVVTPAPTTAPPTPIATNNGIGSGVNGGPGGYSADTNAGEQYQSLEELPEYNKEFFSYAAPEEDFNDIEGAERLAAAMRKNLRIVFIRTPENNGLANAALQLAKQTAESKTAIYVLSKQTDITDLANKLRTVQQSHSEKPEVHFVKYRTPEDAVRAQEIIQHEYDSLRGPSRFASEDVAPVLDFASINEGLQGPHSASSGGGLAAIVPSSNGYLPPKLRL